MIERASWLAAAFLLALGCEGAAGPAGPSGPEGPTGPQGPGSVSSITAGDGLGGGTITSSGTISIAPSGVVGWMVADGEISSQKVGFGYAASATKGGAAADAALLGGKAPAEFAPAAHAHAAADVVGFGAEAVAAMGTKAASNPLHHDRYTDAEAVAAVATSGLPGDLSVGGTITAGGSVRVGGAAVACMAAAAGTIRWTGSAFEGCNGSAWISLSPAPVTTTYTHWGQSTCPATASLVYSGFAAGKHYTHGGGGGNVLCLTSAPSWGPDFNDGAQLGALLYGVEFETGGSGLATLADRQDRDATCAVCSVGRSTALVIPGTNACPAGWTAEYSGYLMSTHYTQQTSEFVCVDASPELAGSATDQNGALWYPTEVQCGPLPCAPYVQNRELTCVVCTR